jgi:hypothetical protein
MVFIFSKDVVNSESNDDGLRNATCYKRSEIFQKKFKALDGRECAHMWQEIATNSTFTFHDHIRCTGMELNISNQPLSSTSLPIKMPPRYWGFSPAHSYIKLPRLPSDKPNPPIHLPSHRQILRELPRAPEPPHS